MKKNIENIKILHCPKNIVKNPYTLAKHERELGLKSWSVTFEQSNYGKDYDEILWNKNDSLFKREFNRWKLLIRAIFKYDIIHFNFGQSITPKWYNTEVLKSQIKNKFIIKLYQLYAKIFEMKELWLLKKLGKIIAVTYQGTDARQIDYCQENFKITFANEFDYNKFLKQQDNHTRWEIKTFEKYADLIYSLNPDLMHVLPQKTKFMPYAHVNLNVWKVKENNDKKNKVPLIIHAPTHRKIKGTKFILEAVGKLKEEGIAFDFQLIEGLSNKEARIIFEKSDILIDQLLAGWYGGLSVELMALGKPVICYIREEDLKFIPKEMKCDIPIINATPETIYNVLKTYLLKDKSEYIELGKKGRSYVEKWHDPKKIAASLRNDYLEKIN